eukprot:TRINITY_DN65957_c0_g1_i1.p1 TRINITY_DN65957_c0_g1~~TRINITY_DN65957_c0_g1_i1.p1  ORF type:complete len:795 (-),score=534.20 TRINITY_DN65957_c0_g1_i1:64-2295(-)
MTGELRTSNLSPKNYYELYMDVTNELREMELFFEDEDSKGDAGHSIEELYENVQHAGNIIPRLYLLVTVGSVYVKSKKAPAKDILFDLVELSRGVQHPMRGLFLRYYLLQISRDKLPDAGSEYEGFGGTVKDAIEFVLQNFGEMNKLWVRMQHQGAVRDRQRREKERRNLRQLVGTSLVRLSQMDGVDLDTYKEVVLPRVLEQIVNCKDVIAQEYLMDSVIQVFPDDYHLATLETFLGTCSQLQSKVNVKQIIISLMDRLADYAKQSPQNVPSGLEMFPLFHQYSSKVIQSNQHISQEDVLQLQVSLIKFASSVYPDRLEYIDNTLGFAAQVLEKAGGKAGVEPGCVKYIRQLLTMPLESLGLRILKLTNYGGLMTYLEYYDRKNVSVKILEAVVFIGEKLDSVDKVDQIFQYISPVIKDQEDAKSADGDDGDDDFEFQQEQHLSAQLFHQIYHDEPAVQVQLYATARQHYGRGGVRRIQHSLPPLVFGSLALAARAHEKEQKRDEDDPPKVKTKKILGFVHEIISALAQHYPELALRLFLQAAAAADAMQYEDIAYEFLSQAFVVYEEEISDSKAQFAAIVLIVATLQTLGCFSEDNYDTLITKATQHSAKLLKKPDQCRAIAQCASLFWTGTDEEPGHRDEKRVLQCLQRALTIANGAIGHQVHLFVEILNRYLYFFDRDCPSITVKYLKGLIALIQEHMPNLDNSDVSEMVRIHYRNTITHIQVKQAVSEKYLAITEDEE